MEEKTNNNTIAKNTLLLYFRMLLIIFIGLFTSRVVLQTLGVDDYGIYQAVGGIIGFMSFLNAALATGSSRFLTYELGTGNVSKLGKTFSTTFYIHLALALIIVVVGESFGLWFLHNKMVIPADRMSAAEICFHLSIISAAINITQVPYGATIIAHEKMNVYAYTSIVDAASKLLIAYILYMGNADKLVIYALLLFTQSICMCLFYRWYCVRKFTEAKLRLDFDKKIFREIGKFSGLDLFASCAIALSQQGVLILLNMFFSPAIVAARAISLQVYGYVNQFVQNFRTAANPQIVKRYAAGDFEGHKRLMVKSTKISFFMLYILGLPVCLTAYPLLHLWLGIVPEYAVIFLQLVIVQNLFAVFDSSFYMALYAKGEIKLNVLTSPTILFLAFPIVYILFKHDISPIALSVAYVVVYFILGCIQKPIMLVKIVGYKWSDLIPMYFDCLKIVIVSIPLPVLYNVFINGIFNNEFFDFICQAMIAVASAGLTIWLWGIDKVDREKMIAMVRSKINRK